jgi:NADH-quinone oxidoreductase subunit N
MVDQILHSFGLLKPETTLAITFCVAIVVHLFARRNRTIGAWVVMAGIVIAGMYVIQQWQLGTNTAFSNMMAVDPFSVFFRLIILLTSFLIVLFSLNSKEIRNETRSSGEYYALLAALTLGMMLMCGATHLLMMYIALELTSLTSYLLAGYTKDAEDSSEASLKYVIFGAVASGLMLYGMSILYGLTGSLDIYSINQALRTLDINLVALIISAVLITVGFGYKISAVPFHFWTPDVYQGAPLTITAFLSVASKAAGFAMLLRFFNISYFDIAAGSLAIGSWSTFEGFGWNKLLAVISVLTMTLGNFVAVWQDNLKRLLAYSSIAHAGYMLLGVVVLSSQGIAAVLIYFVIYLFMNLGAFYVVMLVANATGREDIDAYRGLGFRSPVLGVAMVIFLLSLTGIPPTAGFVGKFYIFAALVNSQWIWLAIVGVLNSVVSLYYYVRILRNMFLREPEGAAAPITIPVMQGVILFVLLVPTILLGLYFTPLVEFAQASVRMFGGM